MAIGMAVVNIACVLKQFVFMLQLEVPGMTAQLQQEVQSAQSYLS